MVRRGQIGRFIRSAGDRLDKCMGIHHYGSDAYTTCEAISRATERYALDDVSLTCSKSPQTWIYLHQLHMQTKCTLSDVSNVELIEGPCT